MNSVDCIREALTKTSNDHKKISIHDNKTWIGDQKFTKRLQSHEHEILQVNRLNSARVKHERQGQDGHT